MTTRPDRLWMYNYMFDNQGTDRVHEFLNGMDEFMSFATSNPEYMDGEKIRCPCSKCRNRKFLDTTTCGSHLYHDGFMKNYYTWSAHGEPLENIQRFQVPNKRRYRTSLTDQVVDVDNVNPYEEMIHNIAASSQANFQMFDEGCSTSAPRVNSSEECDVSSKFFEVLNAANEPLCSGHPTHTKLSAVARLMNLKCENNFSERSMNQIIDLMREFMLPDNVLPDSYYHTKKMVRDLGLPVNRIDVCLNGCMLFWRQDSESELCKFCSQPRYKNNKRKPHKQLFYFPLTPRLQRLYTSNVTAEHMT